MQLNAALIFAVFLTIVPFQQLNAAEIELVMFEEDGCPWCARWNEEIAPIYPKTTEGKIAPLKRLDIHDNHQGAYGEIEGLYFTPTFVVLENGIELGRITGYPGENFFWPLLSEILGKRNLTN